MSTGHNRVLVVDDSLTARMDLVEAFEAAGFESVGCSNLAEARQALRQRPASLVVLDVLLPDGDGLDFLTELKAQPDTGRLPVLLLSTEAEVKSRVKGIGLGADEYIGKPYDLNHVVARARALTVGSAPKAGSAPSDARRTVLVIDDSHTFRHLLVEALEEAGYKVIEAITGEEGLAVAASMQPQAVVVDGMLPGIDGATVIARLKQDRALQGVPTVLLTAADSREDQLRALNAGADVFVRKSDHLGELLLKLSALLRGSVVPERQSASLFAPKRLLAIDDSPTYLESLASELRLEGYDLVLARSGEEALELLRAQPVDCILLDLAMPGISGLQTCQQIKQDPSWREIPLVMLAARDDQAAMLDSINAGADDFISKSQDFEVLKARLRAQLRRRHLEDENRRAQEQRIREQTEARFQRLLNSNIIGVLLAEPGGKITEANQALLAMVGQSRDQLRGGALDWNTLCPPEEREKITAAIAALHRSGSVPPFETELSKPDGSRLPIMIGLVQMEDTAALVGFVIDRTEQREAEEKLKHYALALEASNKELETFSYSVAHDLRAPLRGIDGISQALLDDYGPALDARGQKYLGLVRNSATQMNNLIEALLELGKLTRTELKQQSLDLAQLAKGAADLLKTNQPERAVEVKIAPSLPDTGDPRLLTAVFQNLLGNAWKFTGKVAHPVIEVGVEESDGLKVYFVRDNGAGFDPALQRKLFGVFSRLHNDAEFQGTGIGLATVQRIITRHGGRVWAEGKVGHGATFRFTLHEPG